MENECGISIIIPIYNAENYLDKCISSVLNQSYKQIEVILVNDGSTDNSVDICRNYEKKDSRIKLITQSNKGLVETRKTGIRNAQYQLIGFVDADDWIDSDMYSELINKVQKVDCDVVSSGIIHEYEENGERKEILDNFQEGYYDDLERDIYPSMLWHKETEEFGIYCNLVNKVFKKDILEEVYKEIDSRVFYGEDALAFYSYMIKSKSIYICKSSYYHYRIHKDSMCRNANERLAMNSFYLYKGLEKTFNICKSSKHVLVKQLKNYILQIEAHVLQQLYDINTNRFVVDDNWFDIFINKKVMIYGAGDFGQMMYRHLRKYVNCEIVAWIDKNPANKEKKCNYLIESPLDIRNISYDYILIAVKDKKVADEIKCELINKYQIPGELLLWKENQVESIFKEAYLI